MTKSISNNNGDASSGKFGFRKLMLFLFLFVAAFVFSAYAVYFLICMIPTIVAAIVDRGNPRTLGITVGAMNFAGAVPNWLYIMQQAQDVDYAISLATRPSTLLIAYGAAGIGWIIYFFVARLVAVLIQRKNENKLKNIVKKQQKLVERWGDGVKN